MQVVVYLQQATCLRCLRRRHSLVGWFMANGQHLILLTTSLNTLSLFELNTLHLLIRIMCVCTFVAMLQMCLIFQLSNGKVLCKVYNINNSMYL